VALSTVPPIMCILTCSKVRPTRAGTFDMTNCKRSPRAVVVFLPQEWILQGLQSTVLGGTGLHYTWGWCTAGTFTEGSCDILAKLTAEGPPVACVDDLFSVFVVIITVLE
jgi:hypothetical protein